MPAVYAFVDCRMAGMTGVTPAFFYLAKGEKEMSEKQEVLENGEVEELSNELVYRHYLMNKGKIQELFCKMQLPEYIALHLIESESRHASIYSGRTYLKDLSEKMQLTIRQTSKMVGELKDRGLVLWSHDGNGKEGTFVTITDTGRAMLDEQEKIMKKYYREVIEEFGKENLIELLQLMKQLDTVMSSKIEEMEERERDGRDHRDDE